LQLKLQISRSGGGHCPAVRAAAALRGVIALQLFEQQILSVFCASHQLYGDVMALDSKIKEKNFRTFVIFLRCFFQLFFKGKKNSV
jgi:hypothetical protein